MRGNCDALSDLDLAIGVSPGKEAHLIGRLLRWARQMGEIVGHHESSIGDVRRHRRLFVQYRDRAQLDLVVTTDSEPHIVNVVPLYDPAAVVHCIDAPRPGAASLDKWTFEALEALMNVGKYLRRGALWEARAQLETARSHLFQLLAASQAAPEPEHGLTALFDLEPRPELPAGLEQTLASLNGEAIGTAARQVATLLIAVEEVLASDVSWEPPSDFTRFVLADLEAVAIER